MISSAQSLGSGRLTVTAVPSLAALELTCWPVGQGLFMSGRLQSVAGGTYSWVYDCGSSSKASILAASVSDFRSEHAGTIDLVTLSHFDADHISGVEQLLRGSAVKRLLLPYLPLWRRLLIALDEGVATDSRLFEFFVDPVAYLSARGDIGEILFVPPAGSDDVVPGDEGDPDPDRPIGQAKVEYAEVLEEQADDPALSGNGTVGARLLKPAGRIVIPGLWEFIPYNDAEMEPRASARFKLWASRLGEIIAREGARRAKALKILKALYQHVFGGTAKRKNLISLFLYSGPIGTRVRLGPGYATHPVRWNAASDNFAQLSTGDGYLDTRQRLDALRRFYGRSRRLERAGILQVMHHGAQANWHRGVAAALSPAASIFSSDPKNRKLRHPNAAVLRDFRPYCPVQVDKKKRFRLFAILVLS